MFKCNSKLEQSIRIYLYIYIYVYDLNIFKWYAHIWYQYVNITYIYIYIYARGRGLPDGTSKKISVISKKLRFTVVKRWFFQHCFLSVTHFHDGSIFFGPSKLKLYNDYLWFYFNGFSIFPIGFTRHIFFDEKNMF